jgi:DNA-binding NtrC family response regulator
MLALPQMADTTKHLLLVEDEAALRQAVAEQLCDRGYHVEQAESGEAAVTRLAEFAFDIIITDLRLPGMDGAAVVDAAVRRYPEIIAIVMTGYGTVKDAVELVRRGAWDFVNKPFQIDELLHVLSAALAMEHNSQIFLVDAQGRLRATFFNAPLATMAKVTRDIAAESG